MGNTNHAFDWDVFSDLPELARGRGDTNRAIARYYYLHSLPDKRFVREVNSILFMSDKVNKCCEDIFKKQIFTIPDDDIDDGDWRSGQHRWKLLGKADGPFNGHLASMAFKCTETSTTHDPCVFSIEIDVANAQEPDSGVELYFDTVTIVAIFDKISHDNIEYTKPEGKFFRIGGTDNYKKIYLSSKNNMGLFGEYESEEIIRVKPVRGSYEFSASLNVSVRNTNLVPPNDLELDSKEKRELVKRMLEREILPKPDAAGNVILHEFRHTVVAAKRSKK